MALFQEIPASFGSKFTARVDASQWVSATLLLATACQGSVQGADYDIKVLPEDGGFTMAFTAYNEDMAEAFCRLNALPLPSQSEALRRGPGVFEQLTQEAPMQPVLAQDKQHLRQLIAAAIEQHGLQCDLNHIDVSSIDDFSELFKSSLFNGDISRGDVSNVKTMSAMFLDAAFNGDISAWDISKVSTMSQMFCRSQFNGDISRWDTGSVKDMAWLFESGAFQGDVSAWNTSSVKMLNDMFAHTTFNGDLSRWDLTRARNTRRIFQGSLFNGDISGWNVWRVRTANEMFRDSPFEGDLSSWRFQDLMSCQHMFAGSPFKGNAEHWRVPQDAICDGFLDDAALCKLPAPTFFHWIRALEDIRVLDEQPAWRAHFEDMKGLAQALGLASKNDNLAGFIQQAWTSKQAPLDTLALPSLAPHS